MSAVVPPTADRRARPARRVLAPLAAVAAALALAACGGGGDEASSGGGDGPGARIAHKFGSTQVPADPRRVVAVGYNDQDFALALGVRPLGFRHFQGEDISKRPWAQAALAGSEPRAVGETELGLEKIAALRPDLLLAIYSGITKADHDKLAKIAPTVAQSARYGDYGEPWESQLRTTGRALGREGRAAELERSVKAKVAEAARDRGVRGTSIATVAANEGRFSVFASSDLRTRFFTDLGMTVPAAIDRLAGDRFYASVSEERLALVDRDLIVVYGSEDEVRRSPTFRRLDAVREGRVIYLETENPISQAIGFSSPLSIPYALDRIRPRIQAAIDGDPATPVEPAATAAG